jgi:CubicO group peptidase (beta-lactamase class C family)
MIKRFYTTILLCLAFTTWADAQTIVGSWSGPIKLPQGDLTFVLNVSGTSGSYKATADSPDQNSYGMPVDTLMFDGEVLRFAIEKLKVKYEGTIVRADSVSGDFVQNGATFPLGFKKVGGNAEEVIESEESEAVKEVVVPQEERKVIEKPVSDNDISTKIKSIEPLLEEVLQNYHAAGYAVAVVNKDGIVYSKGFGWRDVENKKPVSANTLFPIGSSTKAFTAALVGKLADEGKVSLDSPVVNYLPKLRFYTNELTNKVTLRDMMSHRTGLPRYDYSWYLFNSNSRDTLLNRVKYMKPSADIREKWQYNNFMYLAQGVLVEHFSGQSWEKNIEEVFFKPLGMTRSNMSISALQQDADVSLGYTVIQDSVLKKLDYYNINAMGPAGSINSSVTELANWVKLWLNGGQWEGKEILSKGYVVDAASSQMVMSSGLPATDYPYISFSNYGLGWTLVSYRGYYRVEHGGNIDGFSASVSFFPYDGIGIVVLSNQNASEVPAVVRNTIADKVLELPYYAWIKPVVNGDEATTKNKETQESKIQDIGKLEGTKPSHKLTDFEGVATHPAFGGIHFSVRNDSLFAKFPEHSLWLKHYHYDVFDGKEVDKLTGIIDSVSEGVKFNFQTSVDGVVSGVNIALEPVIAEPQLFRYSRNYDIPEAELQKYAGDYDLSGQTINVYIKNKSLYVSVPGQPDYKTTPSGEHKFKPDALSGFMFAFEADANGEIIAFYSIQPNGTFKAEKKL